MTIQIHDMLLQMAAIFISSLLKVLPSIAVFFFSLMAFFLFHFVPPNTENVCDVSTLACKLVFQFYLSALTDCVVLVFYFEILTMKCCMSTVEF